MPILRGFLERRSTSSLENPSTDLFQALTYGLDAGMPVHSGTVVNPATAIRVIAVFACVRLISETIAALPIGVHNRDSGSRKEIRVPSEAHIWRRPNPEMSRQFFWELVLGHCVLTGNAFVLKVRDGLGRITEIWPLDPRMISVFRDKASGAKRYRIQDTVYTGDEISHFPAWSRDGLTGLSPVAAAREGIGLAMASEEQAARFYSNGSQVSGILTSDQELDEETVTRLQRRWQKLHAGAKNSWKVAVLDAGAKWQSVGLNPADAEYLDTRKFQVGEIARLFRVPPHLIGDLDRSTSWGSGVEEQNAGFVGYCLLPWIVRFEQIISDELLPPANHYVKFDLAGLMRAKMVDRYTAYQIGRQGGWLSPNDIRELEDMDPIAGGDVYQLTPVGGAPNPGIAPGAPTPPTGGADPNAPTPKSDATTNAQKGSNPTAPDDFTQNT